jgi:uroporphyrinogen decarboxylase
MTGKERFYATVERRPVDRPAVWMSAPVGEELANMCRFYGVKDWHELQVKAGDDVYAFDIPYDSGYATSIAAAFDWYQNGSNVDPEHRTLTADGCFKDAEDPEDLAFFDWPDPEKYIDREECRRRCLAAPEDRAVLGQIWSAHFQDTCAAFGMETALMNMAANPEVYQAVDEKILRFYLRANEIIYESTKGHMDAVIIANDFGSQLGLMISRQMIHDYVMPGAKRIIDQAHQYGLKVIYHSCGAIFDAIDELIEAGADVVHPIQATAKGMAPRRLKEAYGDRVAFCGGVDIQELLPNGTPEQVKAKVRELREIFPTGLVISPSQGVILDDVPPQNIQAMLEEGLKNTKEF